MSSLLHHVIYLLVVFGAGFGLGRIKNAAKLAAIKAEVEKIGTNVGTEVKALASKIKSKL